MKDRLPPYDAAAEQGILGCILDSPSTSMPECEDRLIGPDVFYDLRHRNLYRVLMCMSDAGTPIDMVTVTSQLNAMNKMESVGGSAYLSTLPGLIPSTQNLGAYIETVNGKSLLRSVIKTCSELIGDAFDWQESAEELLDQAERKMLAIRPNRGTGMPDIKQLVQQSINHIEGAFQRKGAIDGIATGFTDLDRLTGGLHPGEMTVIAGFPSSGKTSIAMNIAENVMLSGGKRVGVFSMEMSAVSLVTRFICSHARVNLRNIADGFLTERDFPRLTKAAMKISQAAIWFDDETELSIGRLRAKARRLFQQHQIEVVLIDYLQLMTAVGGTRKIENRQQEITDISRGVKALARELNIPVIILSQLNDDGKLRESRTPGQDGDNVWVLQVDEDEKDRPVGERDCTSVTLVIRKQRNGPCGRVPLTFLKQFTRFESAAKIEPDEPGKEYNPPYND